MLNDFIFSVNAVLPIFVIVLIGALLRRFSSLPQEFFSGCERFVFRVGLPCMLFLDVATSSASELASTLPLVIFCVVGTVAVCLALCLTVPLVVKDNAKRGVTVQGIFRSNVAIMGVPLAISIFGDSCRGKIASLIPFVIITFNVLAVLVLTVFAPSESKKSAGEIIGSVALGVAKNPLIIGIALGLPFMFFNLSLPTSAEKVVTYFSDTVTALSLVSIGAGFDIKKVRQSIAGASVAALFKTAIVPGVMLCIAAALGYRGVSLGLVLIVFGSPTAVSSYIMAKNMEGDDSLASQIILLSTLFSLGTLFLFVFLLKILNFL